MRCGSWACVHHPIPSQKLGLDMYFKHLCLVRRLVKLTSGSAIEQTCLVWDLTVIRPQCIPTCSTPVHSLAHVG